MTMTFAASAMNGHAVRACVALASALLLLACGGGSGSPPAVERHFTNFQAASAVIGQADLESGDRNAGQTSTGPAGFLNPQAMAAAPGGGLLVADSGNNRVLLFPAPNLPGAQASAVLGQSSLTTSLPGTSPQGLNRPLAVAVGAGKVAVADAGSNRVLIYDQLPAAGTRPAAIVVIGQPDPVSSNPACSDRGLNKPFGVAITPRGKLIVADTQNHRVLVWDTIPLDPDNVPAPTLVLGQQTTGHCVENDELQDGTPDTVNDQPVTSNKTLAYPHDVWSDDDRLVVSDTNNHRVLVWTRFPTDNFQPANLVLGHSTFTNTRSNSLHDGQPSVGTPLPGTFNVPAGVQSDGTLLVVGDVVNRRVLIWSRFPTLNGQSADIVLGQPALDQKVSTDGDGDGLPDPTAQQLGSPGRILLTPEALFVSDPLHHRVLVFRRG
jgi:NHL repeat